MAVQEFINLSIAKQRPGVGRNEASHINWSSCALLPDGGPGNYHSDDVFQVMAKARVVLSAVVVCRPLECQECHSTRVPDDERGRQHDTGRLTMLSPDVKPLAAFESVAVPPATRTPRMIAGRHKIELSAGWCRPFVHVTAVGPCFDERCFRKTPLAKFLPHPLMLHIRG